MHTIDLRSDTVTLPTAAMKAAITTAPLGDDVFEEDPTTIELENLAAQKMGMEAGLLVASGTMGNLVSVLTHCTRGEEVILGDASHTYLYEAGGIAALGGIHPRVIGNEPNGTLALEKIESVIRTENVHFPRTRLICLENTQNKCGGRLLSTQYMAEVRQLALQHGLKVHLDGARIFNAAVAFGIDVKALTKDADSVSLCLSKGLAAPVGSVICASQAFITEARRARKILGGGMRQCGIIAAAGIVALNNMVERLADDHAHAQALAQGIAQIKGLAIDPASVETNIVFFDVTHEHLTGHMLVERLNKQGIKMLALGPNCVRAVTHWGIAAPDIDATLVALSEAMESQR
jgi:threonine aldolase